MRDTCTCHSHTEKSVGYMINKCSLMIEEYSKSEAHVAACSTLQKVCAIKALWKGVM